MLKFPKLIDEIQGPVSTPASASNMLGVIYGIMQLLNEDGFVADMFDVRKLLECDQDQITYACQSLYEKLTPLTGKVKTEDKASTAIADMTKEYHTGSSQYASAESDIESDASIGIQQMSLGPSGSAHLLDRAKEIKSEPRSAAIRATVDDT